jgi:hypothetical protein
MSTVTLRMRVGVNANVNFQNKSRLNLINKLVKTPPAGTVATVKEEEQDSLLIITIGTLAILLFDPEVSLLFRDVDEND